MMNRERLRILVNDANWLALGLGLEVGCLGVLAASHYFQPSRWLVLCVLAVVLCVASMVRRLWGRQEDIAAELRKPMPGEDGHEREPRQRAGVC